MNNIHDLEDDAPRYLVEALKAVAPEKVDVDILAENYNPPRPNNMADLRSMHNEGRDRDDRVDADEMKLVLVEEAVTTVNVNNREIADPVIELVGYSYRLTDGVDTAALVHRDGQPLLPKPVLSGLFDPETGAFAQNIRTPNPEGYKELRESMKAFGWLPQFPAIQDENGVVIVGHRRLTVAEELGIEPKIARLTFGDGEAGDAKRAKLAIASNVGFEKLSPLDRKAIAAQMYGSGWSMAKIAETLNVATMTVSRDLRGLTLLNPPADQPNRGGRPRKPEAEPQAEQQTQPPEPEAIEDEPVEEGTATEGEPFNSASAKLRSIKFSSTLFCDLMNVMEPTPEHAALVFGMITHRFGSWAAFDKARKQYNATTSKVTS